MANVSRINGFRPVKHIDGSPWNGQLNRYFVASGDSAAIFQGDLVKLAAVSDTQGQIVPANSGIGSLGGTQGATVFVAGTDTAAVGVMCGVAINPLNLNTPQYRLAFTATYILVADDPTTVFEAQVDGTTGGGNTAGVIATANFNKNYSVTNAGGGSTTTGQSGMTVGASTAATTATLTLKMVGARQQVDNDITTANAKVLVLINSHQFNGTGTTAV